MEDQVIYIERGLRFSGRDMREERLDIPMSPKTIMRRFAKPLAVFGVVFLVIFSVMNADLSVVSDVIANLRGETVTRDSLPPEWLEKYSIVMNGRVRPDDDADHDGLGFLGEERAGTNPYDADTDHDGMSDRDELAQGTDPIMPDSFDNNHDGIPDSWEIANGLDLKKSDAEGDPDVDGLPNIVEYAYGTDPRKADTDGDGFVDAQEIAGGYDPDAPGDAKPSVTVLAEKIGVAAPVVWSVSPTDAEMLGDLEHGVAHYPDSGIPGQPGNVIIAGHSSNYAWAKGDYNSVFRRLGELSPGDVIVFRVKQANGRTFEYAYTVTEKRSTNADDPWIFDDDGKGVVTLSTCWPIGTTFKRMVVRGEMIGGNTTAS
ncbi:MAG TPA: sortase [Candidatus Fimivivens sp.]|nr:sortase [Candidatus Fimivivens sp.]